MSDNDYLDGEEEEDEADASEGSGGESTVFGQYERCGLVRDATESTFHTSGMHSRFTLHEPSCT
jgi:hypothetical protein